MEHQELNKNASVVTQELKDIVAASSDSKDPISTGVAPVPPISAPAPAPGLIGSPTSPPSSEERPSSNNNEETTPTKTNVTADGVPMNSDEALKQFNEVIDDLSVIDQVPQRLVEKIYKAASFITNDNTVEPEAKPTENELKLRKQLDLMRTELDGAGEIILGKIRQLPPQPQLYACKDALLDSLRRIEDKTLTQPEIRCLASLASGCLGALHNVIATTAPSDPLKSRDSQASAPSNNNNNNNNNNKRVRIVPRLSRQPKESAASGSNNLIGSNPFKVEPLASSTMSGKKRKTPLLGSKASSGGGGGGGGNNEKRSRGSVNDLFERFGAY